MEMKITANPELFTGDERPNDWEEVLVVDAEGQVEEAYYAVNGDKFYVPGGVRKMGASIHAWIRLNIKVSAA